MGARVIDGRGPAAGLEARPAAGVAGDTARAEGGGRGEEQASRRRYNTGPRFREGERIIR